LRTTKNRLSFLKIKSLMNLRVIQDKFLTKIMKVLPIIMVMRIKIVKIKTLSSIIALVNLIA